MRAIWDWADCHLQSIEAPHLCVGGLLLFCIGVYVGFMIRSEE